MNLDRMNEIAEDMIEEYDLDYGNAEVDLPDEYMMIEGSRNTTLQVRFDDVEEIVDALITKEEVEKYIAKQIIEAIDYFNVDQEFKELWDRNSRLEPSELIDMLKEDEKFFLEVKEELNKKY